MSRSFQLHRNCRAFGASRSQDGGLAIAMTVAVHRDPQQAVRSSHSTASAAELHQQPVDREGWLPYLIKKDALISWAEPRDGYFGRIDAARLADLTGGKPPADFTASPQGLAA